MTWSVPTRRERDALRAIGREERGQDGAPVVSDADACCRRGWAVPVPGEQQYRLTETGRAVLAEPVTRRTNSPS